MLANLKGIWERCPAISLVNEVYAANGSRVEMQFIHSMNPSECEDFAFRSADQPLTLTVRPDLRILTVLQMLLTKQIFRKYCLVDSYLLDRQILLS